jgi:hypothetical protein
MHFQFACHIRAASRCSPRARWVSAAARMDLTTAYLDEDISYYERGQI